MPIVFAAIAPHGGIVLADDPGPAAVTRAAFEELGRRFDRADPEATIVLTPHGVHVDGSFAVVVAGTLNGRLDDPPAELVAPVERALASAVLDGLQAEGIPSVGVSYGGNDPDEAEMPMDWGTLIPLWFLGGRRQPPPPAGVITPARARPLGEHVLAGAAIARAAARKRIALVASADHGHAHDPDGPYGFDPAAAEYDRAMVELVEANQLERVIELERLAEPAQADSLWQVAMLAGALGDGFEVELLSYEVPTYFGMLCAAYEPRRRA